METEEEKQARLAKEAKAAEQKETPEQKKARKRLEEKQALSRGEYKDSNEKAKKGNFLVEHAIKEDGTVFKKGDAYTGKNENRYLHNGQIRKKD